MKTHVGPRAIRLLLAGIFLIVVALSTAHYLRENRPAVAARHLVIVVLDTVRSDRMSLYGNRRSTTPFLESLARDAVVFDQAKATAPWTVPSHASLFTGLWPAAHKAQWGRFVLKENHLTLAEVLTAAGFNTAALSSNAFVSPETGFGQGFAAFGSVGGPPFQRSQIILNSLQEVIAVDQRNFIFINLIDAHIPYNTLAYGPGFGVEQVAGPIHESDLKWAITAGAREFTDAEMAQHTLAYDAGIRYLDDVVGSVVGILRDKGILDDTLLIITSDHGEGLGAHQEIGHSASAWEEQLAIPLLLRLPGSARGGVRIERTVSLVDIPATALDYLRVERPPAWAGYSTLFQSDDSAVSADYRSYFSEEGRLVNKNLGETYPDFASRVKHTHVLYCDQFKLVVRPDETPILYDLTVDPTELQAISDEGDERIRECLYDYWDLLEAGRFTPFDESATEEEVLDAEKAKNLEKLKSLGYLQ